MSKKQLPCPADPSRQMSTTAWSLSSNQTWTLLAHCVLTAHPAPQQWCHHLRTPRLHHAKCEIGLKPSWCEYVGASKFCPPIKHLTQIPERQTDTKPGRKLTTVFIYSTVLPEKLAWARPYATRNREGRSHSI